MAVAIHFPTGGNVPSTPVGTNSLTARFFAWGRKDSGVTNFKVEVLQGTTPKGQVQLYEGGTNDLVWGAKIEGLQFNVMYSLKISGDGMGNTSSVNFMCNAAVMQLNTDKRGCASLFLFW